MARSLKLIDVLKKQLRQKGLNYRDLSKQLELSESAVKQMFAAGNFSLKRLDAICEILGIELTDLAQLAEADESKIDQLSLENERALIMDMKLLLVAYCVANYWSFDEILARYTLSETELVKYLAKLDRMKMIELQAGNRVRLLISNNFGWHINGPIEQFFRAQVQTHFLDSSFSEEGDLRLVKNGDISLKSRIQLVERLAAIGDYFDELSHQERKLPQDSKQGSTMVLALRQWEFLAFRALERPEG